MSRKKLDIWDRDSRNYWNENVEWIPDRAGHLETRIKLFRDENLENVEYDGKVYWDSATSATNINSIQSLQDFLETYEAYQISETYKAIKVRFSVPRWEPRSDWQARR